MGICRLCLLLGLHSIPVLDKKPRPSCIRELHGSFHTKKRVISPRYRRRNVMIIAPLIDSVIVPVMFAGTKSSFFGTSSYHVHHDETLVCPREHVLLEVANNCDAFCPLSFFPLKSTTQITGCPATARRICFEIDRQTHS